MREPWISGEGALRERMSDPEQTAPDAPVPDLPPYAVAFLAHLRLLIGVPFDYLVPDPRMLPDESIRFFHLDRSWTDRLVDGVFAVGKIGTREQAHHQAAATDIEAQLDEAEPGVRPLQRGLGTLAGARGDGRGGRRPADHRAAAALGARQRLAAHGGLRLRGRSQAHAAAARAPRAVGADRAVRRRGDPHLARGAPPRDPVRRLGHDRTAERAATTPGRQAEPPSETLGGSVETETPEFPLGFRDESLRVVEIAALRKLLSYEADLRDPPRNIDDPEQIKGMPLQNGSSAFAIELLQLPWRQVYDDDAEDASGPHPVAVQAGALADALDVGAAHRCRCEASDERRRPDPRADPAGHGAGPGRRPRAARAGRRVRGLPHARAGSGRAAAAGAASAAVRRPGRARGRPASTCTGRSRTRSPTSGPAPTARPARCRPCPTGGS